MSRSKKPKRRWQPFGPATLIPKTEEQWEALAKSSGFSVEMLKEVERKEMVGCTIWKNNFYQVMMRPAQCPGDWPSMIHLSIRRLDRHPVHDWRHFQRIKNELVGREHEAIELYPAERRLVDTANEYHLWVFADAKAIIPVGFFNTRLVNNNKGGGYANFKQRPREEDSHGEE